ncbi:MAG TPA: hypothetical protein IAA51_10620 [Candidatus Cottocaccamicrobium excrementipullorum]|nr:hypothetical protein [Candidatus Cottocaccamicrobium excrementipullorum]
MEKQEVREAIQAGEAALASMKKAREKLGSAKNWGLFDMLGGGMFSSFVKHSKMDEASLYMDEAKQKLAAFERELKDVSLSADFSIELGSFMRFADTFMDNVFVDIMVQSRINEAITSLDQISSQVSSILAELYPVLGDQEG